MRVLLPAGLAAILLCGCAPNLVWCLRSPDHRTRVEIRERGGEQCVRVASRLDGCYPGVGSRELVFSPDSRHLAYPVERGGRWSVVRDGRSGREWDGVAGLVFSPESGRLAYAALDGAEWRVVVDETPGKPFDSLVAGSLAFDVTGRRLVYAAVRAGLVHAVIDGGTGPGYDAIESLRFSPDGTRCASVARRAGKGVLVADGVEAAPGDALPEFVFSSAAARLACVVQDDAGWFVREEGSSAGPYRFARSLAYRPADDSLCYVARCAEGEAVFVGRERGMWCDSIQAPVFGRTTNRFGYIARRNGQSLVVLDGAVVKTEPRASDLVISPDGSRFVFIADRGGEVSVVDDRTERAFDLLIDGSLVFVRDGRRWACLAGDRARRRLFIVVEGVPERRAFDWNEITRLTRQASLDHGAIVGGAGILREWIAAEAELMLDVHGSRRPRDS